MPEDNFGIELMEQHTKEETIKCPPVTVLKQNFVISGHEEEYDPLSIRRPGFAASNNVALQVDPIASIVPLKSDRNGIQIDPAEKVSHTHL